METAQSFWRGVNLPSPTAGADVSLRLSVFCGTLYAWTTVGEFTTSDPSVFLEAA
jgi:hypothetical protein